MKRNKRLMLLLILTSFVAQAQTGKPTQALTGTWVSEGQMETRTFTLQEGGKGEFLSEHQGMSCMAMLETIVDGQFIMASGVAYNCQQRNNAVAFEFYCQQTSVDALSCKILSTHKKSGKSKQGVENFIRIKK